MMDEATISRLFLAREFVRSGIKSSHLRLPLDRISCVVQLDLALELVMNTVLSAKQVEVRERDSFPVLVDKICELGEGYGAFRSALLRLHSQRNRAQHDGLPPSEETCRVVAAEAETAFRAMIETAFGIEPDQLSLEVLVEDEQVRGILQNGRAALADGRAEDACVEAATSFTLARRRATQQLFPRGLNNASRRAVGSILEAVADAATRSHAGPIGSARGNSVQPWVNSFISHLRRGPSFGFDDPFEEIIEPVVLAGFGVDPEGTPPLSPSCAPRVVRDGWAATPGAVDRCTIGRGCRLRDGVRHTDST